MMSSAEVSSMMMAQNSMFAGQMNFAERVGVGGGLHAYGSPRATNPYEGLPHGVAPPTPFSYGGGGFSGSNYGIGNKVGAMAMSGMGAAATIGGAAMGFAGMLPRVGGMIAPFVDPFSAFGVGRSAGAAMGLGMGGSIAAGVGAAMLPMGLMALGSHAAGAFVQGGQQQALMNTTLGQNFNFMNGNARTGQGFSRADAQAIGNQVRELAHIPELMTSVQELTALIPKLKQSGVMTGVRDAAEFNRRFKDAVQTIREVSKAIGTSMDEAAEFFAHSRRVGFLGKTDQLKNALNVQVTGAMTGMTNGQVMGLQTAGADMATQIGARRSLGTKAVTNIAQGLGAGLQSGAITSSQILDVTGQEGEAGVSALSQKFAGMMMNVGLNSASGRLIMAGAAKFDEEGRYVGLDQSVVRGLNNGSIGVNELKRRGMGLNRRQKLGFVTRQSDIAAEFAGSVGPGGYAGFFEQIADERFGSMGPEAVTRLLEMQGFSAGEADIARGMFGQDAQSQQSQMARLKKREAGIREKYSPEAIWRRTKTKIHHTLFAGLEQAGSEAMTSISKTVDEAIDDIVDRHILTLTKESSDAVAKAFSGNTRELKQLITDAAMAPQGRRTSSGLGRLSAGLVTGALTALDPTRVGGLALGGYISGDIDQFVTEALDGRGETGRYNDMRSLLGVRASVNTKGFVDTQSRLNSGITLKNNRGMGEISSIVREAIGDVDMNDKEQAREAFDRARGAIIDRLSSSFGGAVGSTNLNTLLNMPQDLHRASKADRDLLRTIQDASKQKDLDGMDPLTAVIFASQGKFRGVGRQIDANKLADPGEGAGYMNAAAREQAIKKATESLTGLGLDESTIGILRDDKKLRGILLKGLNDSAIGGENGAMAGQTPEIVQQLLAEQGINVTIEQAAKLKTSSAALRKARTEGDGGVIDYWTGTADRGSKLYDALDSFKKAGSSAQRDLIFGEFRKSGIGLNDALAGLENTGEMGKKITRLSTGLMNIADSGGANFEDNFGRLQGNLSEVAQELASDTTMSPEAKEKIYEKAPWLRDAVLKAQQIQGFKKKRKFKSVEDLAKRLGINDEKGIQAVRAGLGKDTGGEITLSDEQISGLLRTVPGLAAGGAMAPAGTQNAGSERDIPTILGKLDATMKEVKKSVDMNTTVLAYANDLGGDKDVIKKRLNMRENANAGPNGEAKPGGT